MTGKKRLEQILAHTEDARANVASVATDVLIVLQEGPHRLTPDERKRFLKDLAEAEASLGEAVRLVEQA